MYDVAIIGSGPAAVSAALTLKLHNKSIIWFGSKKLSPKVEKSERIANYPGVPMVAGPELNRIFLDQVEEMGIEITEKQVTNITASRRGFMVLGGSDVYEAKTVLLATGAVSGKGFPGEAEFLGHGVSYCATCDGFLYKGKTIAVYCGSREFEQEAEYLAELTAKVYLFTPYADRGVQRDNVALSPGRMKTILGEKKVNGLELSDGSVLDVDAVFVLRPSVVPSALIKGIELDGADIVVDRHMATNKHGCFAAGDCTGRPYQLAKAVGEGNIAAHSIVEYLSTKE